MRLTIAWIVCLAATQCIVIAAVKSRSITSGTLIIVVGCILVAIACSLIAGCGPLGDHQ